MSLSNTVLLQPGGDQLAGAGPHQGVHLEPPVRAAHLPARLPGGGSSQHHRVSGQWTVIGIVVR